MKLRFPHPLTLLVACILLAAVLTYIIPAGEFDRRDDPVTGRSVVVGGTFHRVPANPLGPLATVLSIPKGIADAVQVIAAVFLVGGAFVVVDRTGVLRVAVNGLVRKLGRNEALAIPIVCVAFATGGALENMQEEIIGLVPVLLLLTRRLGYDAVTAVAMSLGAAAIGSAFSPVNPFQVGIAQQVAQVPLFSGAAFRMAVLIPALGLWIAGTMRHAQRSRAGRGVAEAQTRAEIATETIEPPALKEADTGPERTLSSGRSATILLLVVAA
ncbi:MAG: hypothetical protein L0271_06865, partial [Gemmatimonadetes bacterium]|nr:hypothetical protein [Gemmatimonadota bacterium]